MRTQEIRQIPSYRLHKASGNAVVTLSGHDHYLGRFGTRTSRQLYERLIGEWLANNRTTPVPSAGTDTGISVSQVIAGFWNHAKGYYVKNGEPTSEVHLIRSALRTARELYGRTPAANFGPVALKVVREALIAKGLARRTINSHVARIKLAFKWAVENELVPLSLYHGLQAVPGLRAGRSEAREPEPVRPVPDEHVQKILPHLSPQVAAMVKLQMLTGMRSSEVAIMRMQDIDRAGPNWIYRPEHHKTEHYGYQRTVVLGPAAQEILKPLVKPMPWAYLFDPKEAAEVQLSKRCRGREEQGSGERPVIDGRHTSKRRFGDHYTRDSYRKAIDRACVKAKVPHWHPHRLRHNFATLVRKHFGIEAARAALGHHSVEITQIYAEQDRSLVERVASKIG